MIILRIGFALLTLLLGCATADIIFDNKNVNPAFALAIILGFVQCFGQITGWTRWRSKRRIEPLQIKGVGEWRRDRTLS